MPTPPRRFPSQPVRPTARKPAAKKTSSQKAGFRNIEAARDAAQRQGGRRPGPAPTTAAGLRAATGIKPTPSGSEIVKASREGKAKKTAFRKSEALRSARTTPPTPRRAAALRRAARAFPGGEQIGAAALTSSPSGGGGVSRKVAKKPAAKKTGAQKTAFRVGRRKSEALRSARTTPPRKTTRTKS